MTTMTTGETTVVRAAGRALTVRELWTALARLDALGQGDAVVSMLAGSRYVDVVAVAADVDDAVLHGEDTAGDL